MKPNMVYAKTFVVIASLIANVIVVGIALGADLDATAILSLLGGVNAIGAYGVFRIPNEEES